MQQFLYRFMQSKSRPAPPENEPIASDRRTAYLWRFYNGTSTGNYKVFERYHILWGRSILSSVCFCFYQPSRRTVYRWNISVYTRGTVGRRQIVLLETQIEIFLVAGNISPRGYFGTARRNDGRRRIFLSLCLFNCLNFILSPFTTVENIFSKKY